MFGSLRILKVNEKNYGAKGKLILSAQLGMAGEVPVRELQQPLALKKLCHRVVVPPWL